MSDINNIKIEPHFNLAFGKKRVQPKNTSGTIGILNRGKGTKIINNKFSNLNVGIQDEGQGTLAKGNKFE